MMKSRWMPIGAILLVFAIALVLLQQFIPQLTTKSSAVSDQYMSHLDSSRVIEVNIVIDKADWQSILENPTAEEYYPATVVVDGVSTSYVGVRAKGNSSLSSVASSESDRYSLKIDFDQYVDGQSFLGLEKLNLNNGMSDPSYMREYLSYYILEEMGVAVPAYTFANVYINGELFGFYTAVEDIGDAFLSRVYGDTTGSLYKPDGNGSDLVYNGTDESNYTGIVLKNDGNENSFDNLLTMLESLQTGEGLEETLDVDEILRYFAVNTALVNLDSYAGNMKHNYYLYEINGKFTIIPWDYNMSFAGFTASQMDEDGTYLYIDEPVSGVSIDERPLISALLSVDEYLETYHEFLQEIISGVMSEDTMRTKIEEVTSMISYYVEQDPNPFYTYDQFLEAVELYPSTEEEVEANSSSVSESQNTENTGNEEEQNNSTVETVSQTGQQSTMIMQTSAGEGEDDANTDMLVTSNQQADGMPQEETGTETTEDVTSNVQNDMPNQEAFDGNGGGFGGNGGGPGGGMMNGNQTALMTFVQSWTENIQQQLDGELPTTGDTTSFMGFGGGSMGNRGRQNENTNEGDDTSSQNFENPFENDVENDNGQNMERVEQRMAQGGGPGGGAPGGGGGGMPQGGGPGGSGNGTMSFSWQNLWIVLGGMSIILLAAVVIWRMRGNHSI